MPSVSEKSYIEITNLADDDWHYTYIRGTGKFIGSAQIILSDGSGAGDKLCVQVAASDKQAADPNALVDGDFSSANAEVLGDVGGVTNAAGSVHAMAFFDTYMSAFWWRWGVKRTAGAADDGDAVVRVHLEEL